MHKYQLVDEATFYLKWKNRNFDQTDVAVSAKHVPP